MKKKNQFLLMAVFFCISGVIHPQEKDAVFPVLRGPYLGQKPPGKTPELFAPELFDAEHGYHFPVIFSSDLTEAFWKPMERGNNGLLYSKMLKGRWTLPKIIDFGLEKGIGDACFSPDGNKLFFLSFQAPNVGDIERERIWFVERKSSGWSKPKLIDEIIYSHPTHWTFSIATNGNLYFTSEIDGVRGEQDIYVSRFDGEKYLQPEDLGEAINSDGMDLCPCISPDESYLIFTREGEGTKETDLYISFKNSRGKWTKADDMGKKINSEHHDLGPSISPDGKFLFFISRREGNNNIYWVDAKIIEELKPDEVK